jgi:hypothetical protein
MRYVRVPLHVTEVDSVVRTGFLKEDQRQDPEAVQTAVMGLIYRALDNIV